MPPRSAVEKSEHRNEIDDLLLGGKSPRFVSSFLKNEYNEKISHTAIHNYKKKHLNVTKEAVIDYTKKKSKEAKQVQSQKNSQKKKQKAVKKISSDLEKLDIIIDDALNTNIDIERLEGDPEVDQVKVEKLKLEKRKQGISAINAKTNILKQAEPSFEDSIATGFEELTDAIKKSREIYQ